METLELIKSARQGDKNARDLLVTENVGLVWSIVRRFANRGHELEDLFQIGSIGLMKSIDKFDLSFNVKFSTYAVPMITGEIKRFLRDDGMIKVSRTLKETACKVRVTREILEKRLGREPSLEELSIETEISVEDIVMALDAGAEVESLYKTIYQGDDNSIYLIDKLEQNRNESDQVIDKIAIREALASLDEKERKLIDLRYFKNKTQTDIAKNLGISQVQVSRLEKKILKTMRERMV